jgi:hypothetical protein
MKKDFYAYSENIFNNSKIFLNPNTKPIFGRFEEKKYIFKHQIFINNLSFRSSNDYKDKKIKKIAVIGDSYVASFDVLNPWTTILEEKLKRDLDLELYNLGLPGTGPTNWIGHKETLLKIKPDILIIGLVNGILLRPEINFFVDKKESLIYSQYEKENILCKGIIHKDLDSLSIAEIKDLHYIYNKIVSKEIKIPLLSEIYIERNFEYLKELSLLAEKTIIIQFPTFNTYKIIDSYQQKLIKEYSDQNKNISFVNIRALIKEAIDPKDIYIISGDHFNQLGNQYISSIIYENILDELK